MKIKHKWILSFLILFTLTLSCVAAEGNSSQKNSKSGTIPYLTTLTPWNPMPTLETGFIVGYYVNPNVTPLSQINFSALKSAGITDIYVLVTNDNYLPVLTEAKAKADGVGIKTHAWIFPGFNHASEVASMKIGVHLDMETYNMPAHVSEIKAMRKATQGVTFSVTVKPDRWDGNQYYYLIAPYCDYIVPQLYIGDYGKSITSLKRWVYIYNILLPGKIVVGLQTYESYKNTTPLSSNTLLAEIRAVQPNTQGVILFRYGLSNFIEP